MSHFILVFLLILAVAFGAPAPDNSDQCLSCKTQIEELDVKWTNATTVAELVKQLDKECVQKFGKTDPLKVKLCKGVINVVTQIPPSLFHGMEDLAWPIPEAVCATLFKCQMNCCGESDPPEQVHLSLAGNDMSVMGVSWVTLNEDNTVVEYWITGTLKSMLSSGYTTTYKAAGWIGTIHRAKMSNLIPGTSYSYRVGNGLEKWSEIYTFKTLEKDQTMRFAILADMDFEQTVTMANIATLAQSGGIDAVIHSGDESYADGYEPHWDVFFNKIQGFAAYVPYHASPGNHEFWYNFTAFKHRFYLPGVIDEGGSGDNMFYSWNAGYTHFVSGNSETAVDTANFSEDFLAFLQADLAAVDRTAYPFVIVHVHRPLYCSNSNACTSGGGDRLRLQAEDILQSNKVSMVITGHIHSYERTYPMYNGTATQYSYDRPSSPVYIMQGASGNREGNDGPSANPPAWSAASDSSVGFGLLTVSQSALSFQYYASNSEGPVLRDSFDMVI